MYGNNYISHGMVFFDINSMKRALKGVSYFLLCIIVLLLILVVLLQTHWAKNLLREKVQTYVQNKTNTKFEIGSIDFSFPKWVEVNGLFMLDRANDTLLCGKQIKVDVDMIALIQSQYVINKVVLDQIYVNLYNKDKDSTFNYQFVIDAFKSKKTKTATTDTTSALNLEIKDVYVSNTRFKQNDYFGGNLMDIAIQKFHLNVDSINFKDLHVDINDLTVEGLDFKYVITKEQKSSTGKTPNPLFNINKTIIKNSNVYFENIPDYLLSKNAITYLEVVDLNNTTTLNTYTTKSIELNNSFVFFQHRSENEIVKVIQDTVMAIANNTTALGVIVGDIDLQNNAFIYNNISKPKKNAGLDYYHLDLTGVKLVATNTRFDNGNVNTHLKSFAFKDKSGLTLDTLSGRVNMDSSNITVKDFFAQTPYSTIAMEAMIYPQFFIKRNNIKARMPDNEFRLFQTIISEKDLKLLDEALARKYKQQLDILGNLSIDTYIKGNPKQLTIQSLVVNSIKNKDLVINLNGYITNPSDLKKAGYNLNINEVSASKALIVPFIPLGSQPINLPPRLSIKGLVSGNLEDVKTDVKVNSAYGVADVKATLRGFDKPKSMVYDLILTAQNLETGKWIGRDTMLGLLNGRVAVKGNKGFDVKTNNLTVLADIQSFRFNQNVIHNINTDLNLNSGIVKGKASIKDTLIGFSFDGQANVQTDYPSVNAVININKANLLALGLVTDSLMVTAFSTIKVENSTPQNLNAIIKIDSGVLIRNARTIRVDSATALAFVRNDSTFINVVSPFVDAEVNSTVYYNQMAALVQKVINQFIPPTMAASNMIDSSKNIKITEGSINANIAIKPSETYSAFVNNLTFDDPILINGNITTARGDSAVNIKLNLPSLSLGSVHVSPTIGTVLGRNDSLLVDILMDTLQASSFLLYDAHIKGGFSKKNISALITTNNLDKKELYQLNLFATPNNEKGYDISLGKVLILNNTNWLVNEQNVVKTTPDGFNVQHFDVNNQEQQIKINNETASVNSPLLVKISNFQLKTISGVLNEDSLSINGIMNVDLKVTDLKNTIPTMDGHIKVDSLVYQKIKVGNLDVTAQSQNGNVKLDGKLVGDGNDVGLSGTYSAKTLNANIHLDPLTMATAESFAKGFIAKSSGSVTGDINITGEPTKPIWKGDLTFNKAQTTYADYGTLFKIDNQTLKLNYPSVIFDRFTIQDAYNNIMSIDGRINQTPKNDFIADLDIRARDFQAVNNTPIDNKMIHGKAIIDMDGQLKGNIYAPDLSGTLVIKKGTDLTYVRQITAPSATEREGVIKFVDMDTINNLLAINILQEALNQQKQSQKRGSYHFNMNIEVQKEAKFTIVVDPMTGDKLQVQGIAQINTEVNPDGNTALIGSYDLEKGSYDLSYQFIKRKFILQAGSVITLNGDPMNADANITAIYEIKTPAIDLIKNEIGGSTAAANDIYQRKTPFQVLLKLKGKVTKPEISFDIVLPDKAEGVTTEMATTINNKLDQLRADESSMNKQVFALLVFNKFLGEQSSDFFAGNNNGRGNKLLGNQSVSGFLNGAINQIAADLIKGVDVDVNLESVTDDPNAERTDLNVALAKSFLNDRLNISVGKSFTLEGNNPSANNNSNDNNTQFIPDVNTTYKLTKDGKLMLRAYRKSQYEALLDGYFIETGVSFNFTIDYDKFREMLKKNKPK